MHIWASSITVGAADVRVLQLRCSSGAASTARAPAAAPAADGDGGGSVLARLDIWHQFWCELLSSPASVGSWWAGALTAGALDMDMYRWRTELGPLYSGEPLMWYYLAWLVADFVDSVVFQEDAPSPGS
jgi:hypothetical protein